jgi:hypothetical protein
VKLDKKSKGDKRKEKFERAKIKVNEERNNKEFKRMKR